MALDLQEGMLTNKAAHLSRAEKWRLPSPTAVFHRFRELFTNKAASLSMADRIGGRRHLRAALNILGDSLTSQAICRTLAEKMALSFHNKVARDIPVHLITHPNSKAARVSSVVFPPYTRALRSKMPADPARPKMRDDPVLPSKMALRPSLPTSLVIPSKAAVRPNRSAEPRLPPSSRTPRLNTAATPVPNSSRIH